MKIDIGGGTCPAQGYVNLDPRHGEGVWCTALAGPGSIPASDGEAETVRASHVLEHIPAGQPRIDVFNEVARVLQRGGTFEIFVPCVGYTDHEGDGAPHHAGWQGWADPTHVSHWWYPESFWYFCRPDFQANADYGKAMWQAGHFDLRDGWEAHVTLVKP